MSNTRILIIVIACVGFIVAGLMLFKSVAEYKQAEDEYSNLTMYVKHGASDAKSDAAENVGAAEVTLETETKNAADNTKSEDAADVASLVKADKDKKENTPKVEPKKELKRNLNRDDFPDIEVDFDELKKINPSCVAWLYVEGAQINYPVVQGEDNEFYLHHTFEMKKNSAGCVFMDWEVDPELTSWNTFFYGHNMKNGTMFGHLKNFINNPANYKKYPYIYVFRPEGIYRYEIFSYYLDQTDSKMYYTCDTFDEYRAYLREATKLSSKECKAKAKADDNIVTLVTCSGSGAYKRRFFVHGVFVDRYLY